MKETEPNLNTCYDRK